jgi:hypothetical protein
MPGGATASEVHGATSSSAAVVNTSALKAAYKGLVAEMQQDLGDGSKNAFSQKGSRLANLLRSLNTH